MESVAVLEQGGECTNERRGTPFNFTKKVFFFFFGGFCLFLT